MRIYIIKPEMFAKYMNKFVTLFVDLDDITNDQVIIRDQKGDIRRVKQESLITNYNQEDLIKELLNNIEFREVAIEDELIEVGDYHHNDHDYLNYSTSFY